MASGVVDVCLIPEVPFTTAALAKHVDAILARRGHAVVCVAEGAGQDLLAAARGNGKKDAHPTDASGNPILDDVGAYLKGELKRRCTNVDVKYIDPT